MVYMPSLPLLPLLRQLYYLPLNWIMSSLYQLSQISHGHFMFEIPYCSLSQDTLGINNPFWIFFIFFDDDMNLDFSNFQNKEH